MKSYSTDLQGQKDVDVFENDCISDTQACKGSRHSRLHIGSVYSNGRVSSERIKRMWRYIHMSHIHNKSEIGWGFDFMV